MTYIVEYSQSQKCFHVLPLLEACFKNCEAIQNGSPTDYVPIRPCNSIEEGQRWINDARRLLGLAPLSVDETGKLKP